MGKKEYTEMCKLLGVHMMNSKMSSLICYYRLKISGPINWCQTQILLLYLKGVVIARLMSIMVSLVDIWAVGSGQQEEVIE